jgi:MFS transporter, DHA1 family, inner membrane transport protein
MAFFRNDAVNRVNLHYGVQALAQAGGGVFFLVFLLRAGVSVPAALAAQAAILAGRFAVRPAILPLAKRWGLKPMVIVGALLVALQYPLLAQVHGVGAGLLALCVTASIGEVFYWPSYNAYFAAIGDAEHRGHQISAREAMVSVAGIVAPLLGAWALVTIGPGPMFAAVGAIQALSAIPLIGAPNVAIVPAAPGAFRAARLGVILAAADGWFDAWFILVWQIALFVSLSASFSAYGGAMALAGLVGAACGLLLGRHIDAGHGRRAVLIAYAVATAVVLLRAASGGSPWLAVGANALGPFVLSLMLPAAATATYNLAKASPCPMRFHIVTEAGWDVGCSMACLVAATLAESGVPLSIAILLALPALAGAALLLRRYYGNDGSAPIASRSNVIKAVHRASD